MDFCASGSISDHGRWGLREHCDEVMAVPGLRSESRALRGLSRHCHCFRQRPLVLSTLSCIMSDYQIVSTAHLVVLDRYVCTPLAIAAWIRKAQALAMSFDP